MTLASSLALMAALFIFCAAPGPCVFALTARSLSAGARPALGMALGMLMGDLFFLLSAIFGLAVLARSLGEFFVILKILGGAYCIWLGIQAWRQPLGEWSGSECLHHGSLMRNAFTGLLICLSNPKVILFYLGFLPAFMDLESLGYGDIILVTGLVAFAIGSTLAGFVFLSHQARVFLRRTRARRAINRVAGSAMIAAGVTVITK